jgi:hypothetical protein
MRFPSGIDDFEQVAAGLATEAVGQSGPPAPNALQLRHTDISLSRLFSHLQEQ